LLHHRANLWPLVHREYGDAVHRQLVPFRQRLVELGSYAGIDPRGSISSMSDLSVSEKYGHPGFLTADRFLAQDSPTLYHARGFLHHSIGCVSVFLN